MDDVKYLEQQRVVSLVMQPFISLGVSQDDAQLIAAHLVQAEIDGQLGHGLARIKSYLQQAKSGKVNISATVEIIKTKLGWLQVNANSGFAYPAIELTSNKLIQLAQKQGIAGAAIYNSHHAGVLGLHVEKIAQQGAIALMMTNTPAAVAPWGGNVPTFGTNPIAFAAPRINNPPLVIDLSITKVARGSIVKAQRQGKKIPLGYALDKHGQPTTDPTQALQGVLLPMGDAKGAALALMVEILTAGIAGANFSYAASSFFEPKGKSPNVAQFLVVIDPVDTDAIASKIEVLLQFILAQPKARLPGDSKLRKRKNVAKKGMAISQVDYDCLISLTR